MVQFYNSIQPWSGNADMYVNLTGLYNINGLPLTIQFIYYNSYYYMITKKYKTLREFISELNTQPLTPDVLQIKKLLFFNISTLILTLYNKQLFLNDLKTDNLGIEEITDGGETKYNIILIDFDENTVSRYITRGQTFFPFRGLLIFFGRLDANVAEYFPDYYKLNTVALFEIFLTIFVDAKYEYFNNFILIIFILLSCLAISINIYDYLENQNIHKKYLITLI